MAGAPRRAYSNSSAAAGLTFPETAWFSSVMTQRNIQHSQHAPAYRAAQVSAARAKRIIDTIGINVALASLVLVVVVLITNTTGAG